MKTNSFLKTTSTLSIAALLTAKVFAGPGPQAPYPASELTASPQLVSMVRIGRSGGEPPMAHLIHNAKEQTYMASPNHREPGKQAAFSSVPGKTKSMAPKTAAARRTLPAYTTPGGQQIAS